MFEDEEWHVSAKFPSSVPGSSSGTALSALNQDLVTSENLALAEDWAALPACQRKSLLSHMGTASWRLREAHLHLDR